MTNVLAPVARQREFTDLGVVAPGCLLYTLVSGTPNTPLGTTSDAAGLVPNTNPIVASAGGLFPPIYLTPNLAYHFRLTDAAGVPIWDQDPVATGLSPAPIAGGGTGLVTVPPYMVLTGGTTATGPLQTVAPGGGNAILQYRGPAALPVWVTNGAPVPYQLQDQLNAPLDASLGTYFFMVATGNRSIAVTTNPTAGQRLIISFYASSGVCTLTLPTGVNAWRFSAAIPALTATAAGTVDHIGMVFNPIFSTWDVVAYAKGF
jgi:hypothetical protein